MSQPAASRRLAALVPSRFLRLGLVAASVTAIGAATWMGFTFAGLISPLLVALAAAMILTALLMPVQVLLNHKLRLPRYLAAAVTVFGFIGLLVWMFRLVIGRIGGDLDDLRVSLILEVDRLEQLVLNSPLPIGKDTLGAALDQLQTWVQGNQSVIFNGVLTAGSSAASLILGTVLALLSALFLLATGDKVWTWFINLIPRHNAVKLHEAGRRAWVTLTTYIRMQIVIAAADAIGIAIGAMVLGLPFVLPLTLITFVLCIIPFLGAIVSGALFVLVALLAGGPTTALIMLVIVVVVQQLESDLLAPFLMGKAVNLHPLALLVGTAAGSYLVGYVGALFMVPVLAVANTVRLYLSGTDMFPKLDEGGSCLTDSARKLAQGRTPPPPAPRLGDALPEVATPASEQSSDDDAAKSPNDADDHDSDSDT